MRYVVVVTVSLLWLVPAAAADIYCKPQGNECSDRPGSDTSVIRTTVTPHPGSTAAAAANSGAAAVTDASNPGDRVQQQREQDAALEKAQKELKKDLGDKRGEQCKQAQDYYHKTIDAQLIYKVGKDGTKETLSDKDADQARLSAKLEMDRICAQAGG